MECRGTHLTCAGPNGCGRTFEYAKVRTHCEHLMERSSIRHIVKPTFRGGALIVPPVKPGWKHAHATVVSDAVLNEAAAFAEQNEDQYKVLNASGADLTSSAWEQLMAQVISRLITDSRRVSDFNGVAQAPMSQTWTRSRRASCTTNFSWRCLRALVTTPKSAPSAWISPRRQRRSLRVRKQFHPMARREGQPRL